MLTVGTVRAGTGADTAHASALDGAAPRVGTAGEHLNALADFESMKSISKGNDINHRTNCVTMGGFGRRLLSHLRCQN
jgi:hypothetical protein